MINTKEENMNKELIVLFKEKGFTVDLERTDNKVFFMDEELYKGFKENSYKTLFFFGFSPKRTEMSVSLLFLHQIAARFIRNLSQNAEIEVLRKAGELSTDELLEILHSVPFVVGLEYINANWIKNLWQELSKVFAEDIKAFAGTVAEFLTQHDQKINVFGRVYFHLVESKSEDYPFAFLATYSTESEGKKGSHMPLKNALLEYKNQNEQLLKLLSTVSKAADQSAFISELVESGELFSPLKFSSNEAYVFLKEIPLYEDSGILCRIPDWWKKKTNALKMNISVGEKTPSMMGLDTLLNFEPKLAFGDTEFTKEELEQLLIQTAGLSYLKGKWVEVDPDKLRATLEAYEKARTLSEEGLSFAEAMRMELNLADPLGKDNLPIRTEITNGQWLGSIKNRLLNPSELESLALGEDFKATLRHYQQSGFDWLRFMKELGFGALLADDMGLGKTVQILALLEHRREQCQNLGKREKTLLILPASLIGNWQKEADRFAPRLKYKVIHTGSKFEREKLDDYDLYITTYGMVVKQEELSKVKWDLMILDEAQAIKNPGTKQTKAIKQIEASGRIAMTGTPIENRLSDLWSIFDFLNQGLLGTAKEFTEFTKRLKDQEDYSRLRTVVSPFILRRLKTDKSVISDLPDKIELKAYTSLSKKQIVLYKALVKELASALQDAEGIKRKGLVLASILKFKQICNHPDQYLGQENFEPSHSGKFDMLQEICETIYEKRERVLVFTQFREMTRPIADYLESLFNRKGLILHGGTAAKARTALVEQFNGEEYIPFMVLSLKAGGVGLNLTAANHVIHFDRWWNPAIENQATDRAFRIGQQKNVVVHKFVTTGTIEEKIDQMIEQKQKLAGEIVADTGENWITEMNNDELMKLIKLEV